MKLISVVGARPNFIKLAPLSAVINSFNTTSEFKIQHIIVHTGQHYDNNMSDKFFRELNIPKPDINLGINAASHAEQVGLSMIKLEKVLISEKPDWTIVYGDVNATLAASVTAKKIGLKVAHIEAGLRSNDLEMPEEINRIVTDRISDLLFTTDDIADRNLLNEGINKERIIQVGNIMIDSLEKHLSVAKKYSIESILKSGSISNQNIPDISEKNYALITLHRPSNVDSEKILKDLVHFFTKDISGLMPVLWPVHPRTQKKLEEFDLYFKLLKENNIVLMEPLGYHEILRLNMSARIILTDSGGLQEESTLLGTPCLTLRWNTERPMTLREYGGACILVGNDIIKIKEGFEELIHLKIKPFRPPLWDGETAKRILNALIKVSFNDTYTT